MIANAVACFLFSISSNLWVLCIMRFLLGFTQAFCVIYGPVWVNEFSPRKSNTKWMAILHSFVVIGIMVGYILGAITVTVFEKILSWRFAFMLQGWFMILIGICFICCDNSSLDIFSIIKAAPRPKSLSDAHRDRPFNGASSSGEATPSNENLPKSNYDDRSSLHNRKSVRMDVISL